MTLPPQSLQERRAMVRKRLDSIIETAATHGDLLWLYDELRAAAEALGNRDDEIR